MDLIHSRLNELCEGRAGFDVIEGIEGGGGFGCDVNSLGGLHKLHEIYVLTITRNQRCVLTLEMIFRMCVTTLHVQCKGKEKRKEEEAAGALGEKQQEGQIKSGWELGWI